MTALLTIAALVALAATPGAPAPAAAPETPVAIAARLAARQFPQASWRLGEARTADFTYDGRADVALLGVDGPAFVLVVVEGPVTDRSRVLALRLPSGAGSGAVCGPPGDVQANTERPDPGLLARGPGGERLRELADDGADAGALGLVLVHARAAGYCEPFHVLYDGARLAWWRPQPR
ncbi:MAG TPA: hypothetical protein VFP50_17000 [Anaeromyxobacteraceae bacterium]|nr:hypothetical protein [Anaeromyxobacteraceae bacterium]